MTALRADPPDPAPHSPATPDRLPSRLRPVADPCAVEHQARDDTPSAPPVRHLIVSEPLGPTSGYTDRLVALDPWQHSDLYWGRDKVRRTVLAMAPSTVADGQPLVPRLRDGARFWAMVAADGRSLALSTGSFLTLTALHADASATLAHLDELRPHPVHDPATGLSAAWFALDARVVAVSGIAWREEHDLGVLLKALRRCTQWGPVEPSDPVTRHHRRRR